MKIIGHYPEVGEIERDPNLQALIEHGERLLSEDFLFDSPFNDDPRSVSDIDPSSFDLNVDDVGLQDDFDLSEDLSEFVGKIRKEDAGKCKSGCKCKCLRWLIVIFLFIGAVAPFVVFSIMWWSDRTYYDKESAGGLLIQEDSNRVVTNNTKKYYDLFYFIMQDGDSITLIDNMQLNQHRYHKNTGLSKSLGACGIESSKVLTYDWLLILFGLILTLALIATLIVIACHIRKANELEHEDCRLFFEHQNKMINEYANHLYSIKRVQLQRSETLLSLKQQCALQQLDFQQRVMDMLKKEQDMAWKYKEEHLNAVKEYLLNLDYEMKQETQKETKKETGQETKQETKQGTRQEIRQETRQETRQELSVIG